MTDQINPAPAPNPAPALGAPSLDDQIRSFRTTHDAVLTDVLHPDRQARLADLTRLYEMRHAAAPAIDPELGKDAGEVAADALKPLAADQYEISPQSAFAMNLPSEAMETWDSETEASARSWMAAAGLNGSQGLSVASAYGEAGQQGFSDDYTSANEARSTQFLTQRYGDDIAPVADAMRRVVNEVGGEKLKAWLNETGLSVHPRVVRELAAVAEKRGYLKRSA